MTESWLTNPKLAQAILRTALQHLDSGIIAIDAAGIVSSSNPAAQRILRRSHLELVEQPLRTVISEFDIWLLEAIATVIKTNELKKFPGQELYLERDDCWIPVSLQILPMSGAES